MIRFLSFVFTPLSPSAVITEVATCGYKLNRCMAVVHCLAKNAVLIGAVFALGLLENTLIGTQNLLGLMTYRWLVPAVASYSVLEGEICFRLAYSLHAHAVRLGEEAKSK